MNPLVAKPETSTIRRSRAWRFSLRSLFVLMTVAGVVLAPISIELYRSRLVARQATAIRESNGHYHVGQPANRWSAWLAIKLIPWRDEFLGREIRGVNTSRDEFDVSALAHVPQLRELRVFGPIKIRDTGFLHAGVRSLEIRSLEIGAGANHKVGMSLVDARILSRFPQVEEVNLALVPANQLLIDDLGGCSQLQRLRISFAHPDIRGQRPPREMPLIDFAPLGKRKSLQRLQIFQVARATDWSFLAELPALEEVAFSPEGGYSVGGTLQSWEEDYGPIPAGERTPLHYLSKLHSLKRVELYGSPAYAADLERLLANSPVEELRLDVLPDGLDTLRLLRNSPSLRKLHVSVSYFGDHRDTARAILLHLPLKTLTLGPPFDNAR